MTASLRDLRGQLRAAERRFRRAVRHMRGETNWSTAVWAADNAVYVAAKRLADEYNRRRLRYLQQTQIDGIPWWP